MDFIEIEGYKSIKKARVEFKPINILIGANGSGKSNFLSFFTLLQKLYNQNLTEYVASQGGGSRIVHKGQKISSELKANIGFNQNAYSFSLNLSFDKFVFQDEYIWYKGNGNNISNYGSEALLKANSYPRAKWISNYLLSFFKYHFHDTSFNSAFYNSSNIKNDGFYFYPNGANLAAFLWNVNQHNLIHYNRIVSTIRSIAPYFSDFFLVPNQQDYVSLFWTDKFSDQVYGANDLSDGTLRFIALCCVFLQPNLPSVIIIDEPELGLHPAAIVKLSGMLKSAAAKGTKVIIATQSTDLISYFAPSDIVAVDQINGESQFNRLNADNYNEWLDDYTVDELWKRNIISKAQLNF